MATTKDLERFVATGSEKDVSRPEFAEAAADQKMAPDGYVWRGHWEAPYDGTSEATRRLALALSAHKPVWLMSQSGPMVDTPERIRAMVAPLRDRGLKRTLLTIDHFVPTLKDVLARVRPRVVANDDLVERVNRAKIFLTVWEREGVSKPLGALLSKVGMNWVPCERNKEALLAAGVSNVRVVPHVYKAPVARAEKKLRSATDPYYFYSIGKWEPRKNNVAIIEAFLRRFSPKDRAFLWMKTSKFGTFSGYPETPAKALSQLLSKPEVRDKGWDMTNVQHKIAIVTSALSDADIERAHETGDCYVSASHGEAWDMPAFDAVAARARLVHVGFGGSEDYAPSNAVCAWSGERESCHVDYRWEKDSRWAKVDVDLLARSMGEAYEDRQLGGEIDLSRYSAASVGKLMADLCQEVLDAAK